LNVKNEEGEVVRTYEMNKLKKGENKLSWNGLDAAGNSMRAGNYFLEVEAEDSRGAKVATRTAFEGKVTGINYTPEGVVLMVGDQSIRLNDVSKIEDASMKAEQKAKEEQPALKNPDQVKQNSSEEVEGAKPAYKGNIDSIAMSQQQWDQKNKARESMKTPSIEHKGNKG
jgi:flagellar basal-body rod modification protein FlgD